MDSETIDQVRMETSETLRFRFHLPPGHPGFNAAGVPRISKREFGRITVLLGANGSGKSRLLRSLTDKPEINGKVRPVVYVEGGRAITFPPDIDIGVATGSYDQRQSLTVRVHQLLAELETERENVVNDYLAEVYKWLQTGKQGPEPTEPNSRLKRINEAYARLLPRRSFSMTPKHRTPKTDKRALRLRNWYLENNGLSYDIATLSDGEKLADVGEFTPQGALILVDEPELNLHPKLAMDLWNHLETKAADAVFVYATHSLSFAMRPNVTDIVVLGGPTQEPLHIGTPADLGGDDLMPFLGSIAAIITNKRVLVAEGADKSFDKGFYEWLLGPEVAIANVGSCDKVRAALNHEGIWQKAGDVKICGIVDRDFRSNERLKAFTDSGCQVLAYHEAESCLCYPQLLADASLKSGASVSADDIVRLIAKLCDAKIPSVALKRAIARSEVRLSIGPGKGELWPKDIADAEDSLEKWIAAEAPRANQFEANVKACFAEELRLCQQAVETKDVEAMLMIFPGKEMLKPLLNLAGFQSQSAFEKSVFLNLSPDDYPPLVKVREAAMRNLC